MSICSKVIADSVANGIRITTMQITLPKVLLAEFNTHRVFSRNFSSSRAIPNSRMVNMDSFHPLHWGKNKSGMQSDVEEVDDISKTSELWQYGIDMSKRLSEELTANGLHKQYSNRPNDWHIMATGVVTSTDWNNFFELRLHQDAQPEINKLARAMLLCLDTSEPVHLKHGEWHLPYITHDEICRYDYDILCKISAARTCRVSYLKQDGREPSVSDDLLLFERLAGSRPMHLSPLEHQATPMLYSFNKPDIAWAEGETHIDRYGNKWSGNFKGWIQHRQLWQSN